MSKKKYHYKIKDWTFDPITSELTNGSEKIHLQNQVAKVLIELIKANGQTISKKELLEKAWPNTIVTENSLDKTVSELRKVFGDSRANAQFIETLPRKGYRLIAPLKKVEIENQAIPVIKKGSWLKWGIPLLVLSIVAIIYIFNKNTEAKKILSPNGQIIASIKKDGANYALFTENITNGKVDTLDSFSKPESTVISWSSDNTSIIYNTTLAKTDFYSINVFNLLTKKVSYIKFPKEEGMTFSSLKPQGSPSKSLDHKKLSQRNSTVHYITYENNDTIKVLFNDKKISDFKW
ncbi:winged helix-turn-helix domain-containing protein [Flagellimonas sp. CMM7]|uniref:winged helix-turn-helix domain-containing protein n=1 Tax=Flagellimonas sp. CMM7 TaxID=2654676 RepID=UPI0013CFC30E|nr:winged helix-turn-helix domain-containing protein [Flagellimonas sp. CMM7]UII78231.1 winged helix-turn-helix domain-containing protein [Flagellimonas sp. CMM7]